MSDTTECKLSAENDGTPGEREATVKTAIPSPAVLITKEVRLSAAQLREALIEYFGASNDARLMDDYGDKMHDGIILRWTYAEPTP